VTIRYDRQQIVKYQRVDVVADSEEEIDKVSRYLHEHGYQRKLLIKDERKPEWSAWFIRTEVVADTARGDVIHVERGIQ
jgi:hypothetical protein